MFKNNLNKHGTRGLYHYKANKCGWCVKRCACSVQTPAAPLGASDAESSPPLISDMLSRAFSRYPKPGWAVCRDSVLHYCLPACFSLCHPQCVLWNAVHTWRLPPESEVPGSVPIQCQILPMYKTMCRMHTLPLCVDCIVCLTVDVCTVIVGDFIQILLESQIGWLAIYEHLNKNEQKTQSDH